MATYQIIYWHEFPAQVHARDQEGLFRQELPRRFQQVINSASIAAGKSETDAYMMGWRRGRRRDAPGSAAEVAAQVAAELDEAYPMTRLRQMLKDRRKRDPN